MNITPHFTMAEVTSSREGEAAGIDNTLPDIYFSNAKNLSSYVLESIRGRFDVPFSPTSWYRCPALNKLLHGSENSDHMYGRAADLQIKDVPPLTLAAYIRDCLIFKQVILEIRPEKTWVHVSFDAYDQRMETLTSIIQNGKVIYLKGLRNDT